MSDQPPEPHSMIYAQVEPERIADVNWIMEDYAHLAAVNTVDGSAGLLEFHVNPDTFFETMDIIENMPFNVEIVDSFANEW